MIHAYFRTKNFSLKISIVDIFQFYFVSFLWNSIKTTINNTEESIEQLVDKIIPDADYCIRSTHQQNQIEHTSACSNSIDILSKSSGYA